jgi:hypothetical protein
VFGNLALLMVIGLNVGVVVKEHGIVKDALLVIIKE